MSAAMTTVEVPDIGDFDDVPVIEIHVAPGDQIALEDPLVTLESDKATMDVPAPAAGIVKEVVVKVGDKVSQGTALVTLEGDGDGGSDGGGSQPALPKGAAETEVPKAAAGAEAAAEPESAAPEPETPAAEPAAPEPETPAANGGAPATARSASTPPTTEPGRSHPAIYASPSARRLARELGVELSRVSGSGRKERITKEDVQQAAEGGQPSAAPPGPGAGPGLDLPPWPSIDFQKIGPVERVQRSRIQRISAPDLGRNWVMIPHVTHNDEADITELEAWRKRLNAEQRDVKVTMVSFLVVACVAALKEFPNFNSSLDGDELVLKRYYNIGFAADTPGGLVVPVIKQADSKGLLEIAGELTALSGKAREGQLSPADMSGSTFTISSLGGIGGTSFTPIVNAPEVAILGATRSAIKPVWDGSEFAPRLMLPLSLSYA